MRNRRDLEGEAESWEATGRIWEERIHGHNASGGDGRRTDATGAGGGSGFALEIWLLGKLRQGGPGASRRKKAGPRQNQTGRNYPELEITLSVPRTSGGQGRHDATGCMAVFLLMSIFNFVQSCTKRCSILT